jgi:hypothetical protein
MKGSGRRLRQAFLVSATAATAAAMTVAGVTSSAVGAQANLQAGTSVRGPGYPPPGGIYTAFTNCPLRNPVMQETPPGSDPASNGLSLAACTAGHATKGVIKIGNITTPVVQPVDVQFGFFTPPNAAFGGDNTGGIANYAGGILPPLAGLSAMLVTKRNLIPESLLTALACPSSNPAVENLCQTAQQRGGKYLQVFALAQSAGQLTNFGVLSWTQRIKIQLINPLLGNNCYIGSDSNPIVLNPQLSLARGGQLIQENDPNPAKHPDTFVLDITKATASDRTFAAPGVTGCGPGGLANIAVDEAIDSSAGLPAASGANRLSLTGAFGIAATTAGGDSSLTQPQNNAKILLSAFKASVGVPPPSASRAAGRLITFADLHKLGIK